MKRCSRENCQNKAEFECFCNNERKVFCQKDNSKHISEIKAIHANKPLDLEEQKKIQKILIKTLTEKLEIVLHNKKMILELTSKLITDLEECINEKVKQLSDQEKTLHRIINDIKYNMDEMNSCNLKNTFNMSIKNVKAECKKWDLIKITVNTFNAKQIVDEWVKIESEIDNLITNEKIIFFKGNNEEEEKKRNEDLPKNDQPKYVDKTFMRSLTFKNKPLVNNFNNMICKAKHELKWLVSAPYENYTQTKSIWVNCQNCKSNFSTSCWNCTICNYNVCESCGISIGISSPKLRCGKYHELFWRPDASFYYQLKGNARGFRCTSCNAIKDEAHWHCQECNFDVCISCGKNKKQIPPTSNPKCLQNHILIQNNNSAKPSEICITLSCCSCKKEINNSFYYTCKTCLYFICSKCFDFINYSITGLPILFCQSYHPPLWVKASNFECDYCFKIVNQEHYSCSPCNYHICFECSNIIFNYAIKGVTLMHGSNNHPLEWLNNTIERNNGKQIECVNCKNQFLRAGMFYCSTCKMNICMLCANDPDRKISRNQQQRSLQIDNQFILRQIQLSGESLLRRLN